MVCVLTFICSFTSFAQTVSNFYVTAVIPENQIDNRQTYFDLLTEPNQKQTLEIKVTNSKSEDITIITELNSASTGRNGLIVYTDPDIRDENLKTSITDIAQLREKTITIPADSSSSVYIDIAMPEEAVYGTILGGITFTEQEQEDEELNSETDSGVSIKNKITYVIGLKVTESNDTVTPDFELVSINPTLINYKPAVSVKVRNTEPLIVKDMEVNAEIFTAGEETSKSLYNLSLKNSEMAPTSTGDFIIDWENTEFTAGTYRLKMAIIYGERQWTWDENFTIEDKQASEINSGAIDVNPPAVTTIRSIWIYILIGAAAIAVTAYASYKAGKSKNQSRVNR